MPGRLAIAKLNARCIVADSPHAASIVDRATRALRGEFPDAARRAFASWLDSSDETVWIVRRLDLSVMTAADVPTDTLAGAVVMALGRALGESLSGEGDGANVIRFENRAAYLASFMTDAATGDAWSRWYYAPLRGLKILSTSCAIRTVIVQDPNVGRRALEGLGATALARVAALLTPQDDALIVDCLAEAAGGDDADEGASLTAAWTACQRQFRDAHQPISLLVECVRSGWARKGHGFLPAMRKIRSVLEFVQSLGAKQREHFASALDGGDEGMAPIGAFGSATSVPRRVLREMLAHVAPFQRERLHDSFAGVTATQFGGLLILMRDVQELPWEEMTRDWPQPKWAASAFRILQWLTLATCVGRERSAAALHDEALRYVFGVPPAEPLASIARWLRKVGRHRCSQAACVLPVEPVATLASRAGTAGALGFDRCSGISRAWSRTFAFAASCTLRRFARRLPGFAEASPQYLWENFLGSDASLECEEERVVVRYARPRLHLVLTLTGMTRGLTTGRDVRGCPVIVFAKE